MSFLGECPPWMSQQVIQEALTSNCQSNAVFSSESYGWHGKLKNSLTVKCTKCIMWLSFWETDREGNLGITVLFSFRNTFGTCDGRRTQFWGVREAIWSMFSCIPGLSALSGSARGRKCVLLCDTRGRKPRDRHIRFGDTVKSSQLALSFTVRDATVL